MENGVRTIEYAGFFFLLSFIVKSEKKAKKENICWLTIPVKYATIFSIENKMEVKMKNFFFCKLTLKSLFHQACWEMWARNCLWQSYWMKRNHYKVNTSNNVTSVHIGKPCFHRWHAYILTYGWTIENGQCIVQESAQKNFDTLLFSFLTLFLFNNKIDFSNRTKYWNQNILLRETI